jgi:hypothetical protein
MTDTKDIEAEFSEISVAKPPSTMTTATQLQSGPVIDPLKRLFLYSADEWEGFIDEWASACLKAKYKKVERFTGAHDKGIDVVGFADEGLLMGVWDNYQCKHYDHALYPSDAWPEIGKMLWYSFKGHYKPPRDYFFAAPRGTGTTLSQLLANPAALKAELKKVWDKDCRDKITTTGSVSLMGDFVQYVDQFDFSIFKTKPVREVLDQCKDTPYFVGRFGGGLPPRPKPGAPPDEIDATESGYVTQLLAAYADHTKKVIADLATLKNWNKLEQHFKRQREAFYHAESLRVFVRDKVEPGTFESLQEEIYHGVVDTCDADHADGYERVVAVTGAAQNLPIDAHPLAPSTFVQDRHGICHQLANVDRLKWTK